jgi:hypothetical protein
MDPPSIHTWPVKKEATTKFPRRLIQEKAKPPIEPTAPSLRTLAVVGQSTFTAWAGDCFSQSPILKAPDDLPPHPDLVASTSIGSCCGLAWVVVVVQRSTTLRLPPACHPHTTVHTVLIGGYAGRGGYTTESIL